MIAVRKFENYKGFCMDDMLNIFSKGEGESAVLTWRDNDDAVRTEKCYYLDNNDTEITVFYVNDFNSSRHVLEFILKKMKNRT